MPQDDHNPVSGISGSLQSRLDEPGADPLPLMAWPHGHRREAERFDHAGFRDDRQPAEQDLSHYLRVYFGDQRKPDEPAIAQRIHQPRFGILTEGEAIHLKDRCVVSGCFWSDGQFQPPRSPKLHTRRFVEHGEANA